jgi:hypothetical protein
MAEDGAPNTEEATVLWRRYCERKRKAKKVGAAPPPPLLDAAFDAGDDGCSAAVGTDGTVARRRPRAPAAPRRDGPWRCTVCTTADNPHEAARCRVCGRPAGHAPAGAAYARELEKELKLDAVAQRHARKALRELAPRLRNSDALLVELDLQYIGIGDSGCAALEKIMERNTACRRLNLFANGVGDAGALCVARLLVRHGRVRAVNLGRNRIGERGGDAIARAVWDAERAALADAEARLAAAAERARRAHAAALEAYAAERAAVEARGEYWREEDRPPPVMKPVGGGGSHSGDDGGGKGLCCITEVVLMFNPMPERTRERVEELLAGAQDRAKAEAAAARGRAAAAGARAKAEKAAADVAAMRKMREDDQREAMVKADREMRRKRQLNKGRAGTPPAHDPQRGGPGLGAKGVEGAVLAMAVGAVANAAVMMVVRGQARVRAAAEAEARRAAEEARGAARRAELAQLGLAQASGEEESAAAAAAAAREETGRLVALARKNRAWCKELQDALAAGAKRGEQAAASFVFAGPGAAVLAQKQKALRLEQWKEQQRRKAAEGDGGTPPPLLPPPPPPAEGTLPPIGGARGAGAAAAAAGMAAPSTDASSSLPPPPPHGDVFEHMHGHESLESMVEAKLAGMALSQGATAVHARELREQQELQDLAGGAAAAAAMAVVRRTAEAQKTGLAEEGGDDGMAAAAGQMAVFDVGASAVRPILDASFNAGGDARSHAHDAGAGAEGPRRALAGMVAAVAGAAAAALALAEDAALGRGERGTDADAGVARAVRRAALAAALRAGEGRVGAVEVVGYLDVARLRYMLKRARPRKAAMGGATTAGLVKPPEKKKAVAGSKAAELEAARAKAVADEFDFGADMAADMAAEEQEKKAFALPPIKALERWQERKTHLPALSYSEARLKMRAELLRRSAPDG